MTTEINSSYTTPWNVDLFCLDEEPFGLKYEGQLRAAVMTGRTRWAIGFQTSHTNHRVQWRVKRRKSPAYAVADTDWNGQDIWVPWDGAFASGSESSNDEWGDWQGTTSETASSLVDVGGYEGYWKRYSTTIAIPYDFTTYDAAIIEIRVQAFNPSSSPHYVSEWAYAQVFVGYRPVVDLSAGQGADAVDVHVETNWTRNGNRLEWKTFWGYSGGYLAWLGYPNYSFQDLDADDDIEVDVRWMSTDSTGGDDPMHLISLCVDSSTESEICYYTSDGFRGTFASGGYEGYLDVPVDGVDPSTSVPEPTDVTISADGTVTIEGSGWDAVYAVAIYADEYGEVHSQTLDLDESSGTWTAEIAYPPYDVEFTVRVACVTNSNLAWWEYTASCPSNGLVTFDWDGYEQVSFAYNAAPDEAIELMGESVSVLGKQLPTSIHGVGRTNSFSMAATVVNPDVIEDVKDNAWSMWRTLYADAGHDWIMRTPNGVRRQVRITGLSVSRETATADSLITISINCSEVV